MVVPRAVPAANLSALAAFAEVFLQMTGGGSGGPSLFDVHSGATSRGSAFIDGYLIHSRLLARSTPADPAPVRRITAADVEAVLGVARAMRRVVAEAFGVEERRLLFAAPAFFSRIAAAGEAHVTNDEYWHMHVDRRQYPAFEYTSLAYFGGAGTNFTGGSFFFGGAAAGARGEEEVVPEEGTINAFSSGEENPHRVAKVTAGVRRAFTVAFTCDPAAGAADPADAADAAEEGAGGGGVWLRKAREAAAESGER